MRTALLLMALLVSGTAWAGKNYECHDILSPWGAGEVLKLHINDNGITGTVTMDDIVIETSFGLDGLEREWFWTQGNNSYSVFVFPDMTGGYYDWQQVDKDDNTSPRVFYSCEKVTERSHQSDG